MERFKVRGLIYGLLLPIVTIAAIQFPLISVRQHLLLVSIIMIAVVPILISVDVVHPRVYSPLIYLSAVSVLYQTSLVSNHLWGWDIHYLYYVSTVIVDEAGIPLEAAISSSPLLAVTSLASLVSIVTEWDLVWVFKAVFPLIFAIVPVTIYAVAREHVARKTAALAPFFLVFYYGFFKALPSKQALGGLFLVLLLWLVTTERRNRTFSLLIVVCAIGLVIAHYGTSLFFLLIFGASAITWTIYRRLTSRIDYISASRGLLPVLIVGTVWFGWHGYTAAATNLQTLLILLADTVHTIVYGSIFSSDRSGIAYATRAYGGFLWTTYKAIYASIVVITGSGVIWAGAKWFRGESSDVNPSYLWYAFFTMAFLGVSVILTFRLGFDRALTLSLFVIAPMAAYSFHKVSSPVPGGTHLTAVFLVVMFCFSSGAVFAMAGSEVPRYAIGFTDGTGWQVYDDSEVGASRWVETYLGGGDVGVFNRWVVTKSRDGLLISEVVPPDRIVRVNPEDHRADCQLFYMSGAPMSSTDQATDYIDPTSTAYWDGTLRRQGKLFETTDVAVYSC